MYKEGSSPSRTTANSIQRRPHHTSEARFRTSQQNPQNKLHRSSNSEAAENLQTELATTGISISHFIQKQYSKPAPFCISIIPIHASEEQRKTTPPHGSAELLTWINARNFLSSGISKQDDTLTASGNCTQ
ncbi:hypothetical protein Nepgr_005330 [Nepenthes gracilis]|uniref:Uncharacterized protein n=1 Tax=Nepenthes gracilis TaxID=150966 RepID=A0AAD3S347_NEPGR|nr:hypothetical protein Nepgr_005330 [Nepenthes gracilis]